MAYLPVLKAILPYLGPLVSAAAPMLTRNANDSGSAQPTTAQLINELQEAVKNNANSLKIIATQLQASVEAFDERESNDQKKLADIRTLVEAKTAESSAMKSAVDAAVKDIQASKLLSLVTLGLALAAIAISILK